MKRNYFISPYIKGALICIQCGELFHDKFVNINKRKQFPGITYCSKCYKPFALQRLSIITKELWKSEEYKNKHSETIKELWKNEEYRKKNKGSTEHKFTEESKIKSSKAHIGYKQSDSHKLAIGIGNLGRVVSSKTRNKISISNIGKKRTKEAKIKMSLSKLGCKHTEEARKKMSIANSGINSFWYGRKHKEVSKQKMQENARIRCQNPDYLYKLIMVPGKHPNKIETILGVGLNIGQNEWNYTGDGTKIIGGKNPDFVNENKKKIIELFGDYWHNRKFFPKAQTPEERIEHFKKYGYDTLVIWESEMKQNIEQVKQKINVFNIL